MTLRYKSNSSSDLVSPIPTAWLKYWLDLFTCFGLSFTFGDGHLKELIIHISEWKKSSDISKEIEFLRD